jgi:hypothetical protein
MFWALSFFFLFLPWYGCSYRTLLKEKKNQLQNQASKLRGGLSTLNATRESVAKMQIVCQDKAVVVAQAKKECEEILVEIVSEKRVVDEQELKVKKPFSLSLSLSVCLSLVSKLGFAIAH